MDFLQNYLTMLRRDGEPDYVPSFVQEIMPKIYRDADDYFYINDIDVDLLPLGLKDVTIHKALGFDSTWVTPPHGERVFSDESDALWKKLNNELSERQKKQGYKINRHGTLVKETILNGFPYTYQHEGVLKTEDLFRRWYEGSYVSEPSEDRGHPVERINRTVENGLKNDFLPVFATNLVVEPILATIGLFGFARYSRTNPDFVRYVIEKNLELSNQKLDLILQSKAPVVIIPDDCAYKNRTILDPKQYRDFVIPHFRRMVKKCHKKDKLVIFHSDGFVEPLYPLLIDIGVDAHDSLEPAAGMDLVHLKKEYGDKITLIGNIDVSNLLPYGTREEVAVATKECLKAGGPGGGYIFAPCTDLTNSCNFDNVITMMNTYRKHRNYN